MHAVNISIYRRLLQSHYRPGFAFFCSVFSCSSQPCPCASTTTGWARSNEQEKFDYKILVYYGTVMARYGVLPPLLVYFSAPSHLQWRVLGLSLHLATHPLGPKYSLSTSDSLANRLIWFLWSSLAVVWQKMWVQTNVPFSFSSRSSRRDAVHHDRSFS